MPGKVREEREPKDPQRQSRAELVRAATFEDWQARPGAKLEKQGRDGLKLVAAKAPEFIYDADGEVVGVDAWVQLFDERGRELPIDPHRRIINPPTVPRSGVRLVDTGRVERGEPVMERRVAADPTAAFWEAVWDSVERAPNPEGWRTRGTVTTVYASATDGYLLTFDSPYANARSGSGGAILDTGTSLRVGQEFNGTFYSCYEDFLGFDTSAIPDDDNVSAVDLALWLLTDSSTTADFIIESRQRSWGPTLTTGDFVPGASLGSLALLASLSTSGIGPTDSYISLVSEAAFLSVANLQTGTVELMLCSSRHRLSNAPTGSESVLFGSADTAGTTQDPKLTITHAGPGSSSFFTSRPNRIWRLG